MHINSNLVAELSLPPHVITQVSEDWIPPWQETTGIAIRVAAFGYGHRTIILPHNVILPYQEKILT